MRTLTLPGGEPVPVLGQGTWGMGEQPASRAAEVAALRRGLDLGMTPDRHGRDVRRGRCRGGGGRGDPRPARRRCSWSARSTRTTRRRKGTVAACERSLKRLGTDRLDLYLLHWRGAHPLAETVAAFERLQRDGKIRHWGVSNLDADEMDGAGGRAGRRAPAPANQVLYNPSRRGIEWDLLPWCREHGMPVMAYSPIEQGRLPTSGVLGAIARAHGCTAFQIALAWVAGAARRDGDPQGRRASSMSRRTPRRSTWRLRRRISPPSTASSRRRRASGRWPCSERCHRPAPWPA